MSENTSKHLIETFPNGLTVVAEFMDWCESVACAILVPAGCNYDPPNRLGLAYLTCEMILRGAGPYNSRDLIAAFENLGAERGESVSHSHTAFSAATLASSFPETLKLLAQIIREPHFPEDQLEQGKQVVLQEIYSVEDEPGRKVMIELSKNALPVPWGNPGFGNVESVQETTIDDIRRFHGRFYQPQETIISVAGKFDGNLLLEMVSQFFGDWQPNEPPMISEGKTGDPVLYIPYDSAQTHIGLAYPGVPFRHPDYLLALSGVNVLSGGMSSRLFTEIREKRGLCYSVGASYYSYRDRGGVTCYCGTSADRAQESLDVLIQELARLSEGITEKELELLRIRAKSSLVMQQESTNSRAGSIARDWYHLGRIRTMSEIEAKINGLSRDAINDYVAAHPTGPFHLAVLGPAPLEFTAQKSSHSQS